MYLHSNIKFLRLSTKKTQAQFGALFGKSRSNIDSYERGVAKPDEETQVKISIYFNVPLEVLLTKDVSVNPGLLHLGDNSPSTEQVLKAKDETIKNLQQQLEYMQKQYESLLKKLKVA